MPHAWIAVCRAVSRLMRMQYGSTPWPLVWLDGFLIGVVVGMTFVALLFGGAFVLWGFTRV